MNKLEKLIAQAPPEEQEELLNTAMEYKNSLMREKAEKSFLPFVKQMWPSFVDGRHHKVMAKKFEEIANGKIRRLIVNMPPRHTKSEFASFLLPAWFLGKYPNKKIIQCSNTAELAVGFGRKVRNLVGSEIYSTVFPNVGLKQDSKAAGRWNTNHGGEYFAIGVGGTVTGKGADLLIIDDPHSEQEAAIASTNPEIYDKVFEWYSSGPRQRLQPGGSIVVVMCMTGETSVLMADGTEKQLREIRAGDIVATFDNGKLTTAKVNNWQSSGNDSIYKIQTRSGRILRANERHPFLVDNNGVLEWTRVNQLMIGDELVSLKDATGQPVQKQNQESVERANQKILTIGKIHTHHIKNLGTTDDGKGKNALVEIQSTVKDFVINAIQHNIRRQNKLQSKIEQGVSSIDTESRLSNMKKWFWSVITNVMFAANRLQYTILERIGTVNCVLTIAMTQEKSEDCCATTATLQSDMQKHQKLRSQLQHISDFTADPIISIIHDGVEEVFDVEVDRTENFITNGIVSHNTRWAKRDLTGKIVQSWIDKDGEEWEIIDFPAILPSGLPLWPEFWSLEELEALRLELPLSKWNAQYQQQPTSEEGAIVKREWWKIWEKENPPQCDFVIQSWDTAFTKNERSDYSACTTWGVFYMNENEEDPHVILLDAFKERMEFPELKERAYQHYMEWEPDAFVVEAKAAGSPLIYELRQRGIPVQEFTPTRGNDKIARINSVSDLFASGKVWAPRKRWAEEVIEEMAAFPNSDHDDLCDSSTQALIRFRKGGFIRLDTDEKDEPTYTRRRSAYY